MNMILEASWLWYFLKSKYNSTWMWKYIIIITVPWCFHLSDFTIVLLQNAFVRLYPYLANNNTHHSNMLFFLNFMTACLMPAVEQIGAISCCQLWCDARHRKLASISIMTLAGKDNGPLTPSLPAFYGLMFEPPWHQPLISTFVLVRPKLAMLSLLANVSNGSSLEHNQCDVTHDNTTEA